MVLLKKLVCLSLFIVFHSCMIKKDVVSLYEKPHSDTHGNVFRVLTYNVLTGFQKDARQAERFVQWAKQQDADVIGFQELSTFTQDSLERFAQRYGHHYAVLHKGNGSPIGITSRYPLVNVKKVSGAMHHGCIYAEVSGFHLFVTHLSPFSYEKCLQEMKGILTMAAGIPEQEKTMILGDFNSFSPADSLSYPIKRPYGVVQSLLENGFYDTYMQVNEQFENSFPTIKYAPKVRYSTRIDYVFANQAASQQVIDAKFIKDSITNNLSDHYPLMAEFAR